MTSPARVASRITRSIERRAASGFALDAAYLAGLDPEVTLEHLGQHEVNFERLGQPKAASLMAVLRRLHANAGLV